MSIVSDMIAEGLRQRSRQQAWADFPQSSAVASAGYDWGEGTLTVTFRPFSTYRYIGVPPATWERLLAAGSKGSFVATEVIPVYALG